MSGQGWHWRYCSSPLFAFLFSSKELHISTCYNVIITSYGRNVYGFAYANQLPMDVTFPLLSRSSISHDMLLPSPISLFPLSLKQPSPDGVIFQPGIMNEKTWTIKRSLVVKSEGGWREGFLGHSKYSVWYCTSDTCHKKLSEPIVCKKQILSPNVNYGL